MCFIFNRLVSPFNPRSGAIVQISNLRHSLSEKNMELKRVVANAEQRSAQREQAFQNQVIVGHSAARLFSLFVQMSS